MPTLQDLKQRKEGLQQCYATTLCAGCGCEMRPDYWQPQVTSLCVTCEDKINNRVMSWPDPVEPGQ